MRNAMQLKAIINNIAKEKGIRPQLALQNYMLERFLERVSLSRYRDNFVLTKVQAQNIKYTVTEDCSQCHRRKAWNDKCN